REEAPATKDNEMLATQLDDVALVDLGVLVVRDRLIMIGTAFFLVRFLRVGRCPGRIGLRFRLRRRPRCPRRGGRRRGGLRSGWGRRCRSRFRRRWRRWRRGRGLCRRLGRLTLLGLSWTTGWRTGIRVAGHLEERRP